MDFDTQAGLFYNTLNDNEKEMVQYIRNHKQEVIAMPINELAKVLLSSKSSVLRLAKKNTLVQNLFCIETLARVDTICLDKTGTLTEGKLKVDDVICLDEHFNIDQIIKNMNYCLEDGNMTSMALHQ